MKTSLTKLFFPVMTCFLIIQGCGGVNLTRRDLEKVNTMTVGRAKTPLLEVKTIAGVVLVGAVGSYIDYNASKNFQSQRGSRPTDFGELLVRKFAEKARKDIKGWPETKILDGPVPKSKEFDGPSALFSFGTIMLTADDYLYAEAFLTMKDSEGRVICDKFGRFNGYQAKRTQRSPDQYIDNDGELLREEIEYAADYLAADFVNVINESLAGQ
jgi:hypothetical protein